jgi:hypothetical protein
MKPMKGISRIDQPEKYNHGFFVRLKRRGKIHSAFFADNAHGGRAAALRAAQKHYRELLRQYGTMKKPPQFSLVREAVGRGPRNKPVSTGLTVSKLSWVQASGFRCLAYRDGQSRWVNFYSGNLLSGPVRVIDSGTRHPD